MAVVTRYIDTASSGGDGTTQGHSGTTAAYASMNAWEAAEQTDLVSAGDSHEVYCAGGADTTICAILGWTTGASNRLKVAGDPTAPDGDGVNPGTTFSTSYYYKETTGGDAHGLQVSENYVDVEDLQFRNSASSGTNRRCITFGTIPTGCDNYVRRCFFDNNVSIAQSWLVYLADADQVVTFESCFFDMQQAIDQTASFAAYIWLGTANFYNCTLVREIKRGPDSVRGFVVEATATLVAKNCAIAGFNDDINGTGTITADYNASDDLDGTNTIDISPGADPDGWQAAFNNWGTEWLIKDANSVLYDAGLNSVIPSADKQGNTFNTDDVGCFAFSGIVGRGLLNGLKLERARLV